MDIWFSRKYSNENTLVRLLGGSPVASLQMLPYRMTFYGREVELYYLSGICTLPQHRGKGFASELIVEAHSELRRRGVPLAVLIPASAELYGYYARFGYEKVFGADSRPIPLGDILDSSADIAEAYRRFDAVYRSLDFCVQKSFDDFAAIAADYNSDGRPLKTDLDGAAYLIDHMPLLRIYAKNNPAHSFILHLQAGCGEPEAFYRIEHGKVFMCDHALGTTDDNHAGLTHSTFGEAGGGMTNASVVVADRQLLARLLFGYRTNALPEPCRSLFPEHRPIMNLMLE